jgi:tetratricopeptide (TPR) repeat protein
MLSLARTERMEKDAPASGAVLGARERWARFLLDHGDIAAASVELQDILRIAGDDARAPVAMAHSDLARVALSRGDTRTALDESKRALALLERDAGLYDVRIGPALWRIHATALARSGDAAGAQNWNLRALEASRRYDDPSSPSVTLAASTVP